LTLSKDAQIISLSSFAHNRTRGLKMRSTNLMQQIRARLEHIEAKIDKYKRTHNIEKLRKELEATTKQIYEAEDKEELGNLIMLKNIIKSKIEKQK